MMLEPHSLPTPDLSLGGNKAPSQTAGLTRSLSVRRARNPGDLKAPLGIKAGEVLGALDSGCLFAVGVGPPARS